MAMGIGHDMALPGDLYYRYLEIQTHEECLGPAPFGSSSPNRAKALHIVESNGLNPCVFLLKLCVVPFVAWRPRSEPWRVTSGVAGANLDGYVALPPAATAGSVVRKAHAREQCEDV